MTVVNYSVQDTFWPEHPVSGTASTGSSRIPCASDGPGGRLCAQTSSFSFAVLLVEIPLGILHRVVDAAQWLAVAAAVVVLIALPLLIPWNVVGTIWQIFGALTSGCWGRWLALGIDYNYSRSASDAWATSS